MPAKRLQQKLRLQCNVAIAVGWDKAASAAAGPPRPGGTGGSVPAWAIVHPGPHKTGSLGEGNLPQFRLGDLHGRPKGAAVRPALGLRPRAIACRRSAADLCGEFLLKSRKAIYDPRPKTYFKYFWYAATASVSQRSFSAWPLWPRMWVKRSW